ncbi:MAG: ethylbenzene dehydrogenase-related protein [Acidiferrobacterales bacterium]
MSSNKIDNRRRALLAAPFVLAMGWLLWPVRRAAAARKATLIAKQVERAPADPADPLWGDADVLEVPLAPQAVVKPRTYEAGVKLIKVRALYEKERLAFLVEWGDPQHDAMAGGVSAFQDAVAVEFPVNPAGGIPYFGMGEPDRPVTIYQWKSDWQSGLDKDVDEKYPNMAVDWYPFSGRGPGEIAEATDYGKKAADRVFHTSWWVGNTIADPALQAQRPVNKLQAEGFGTVKPVESDRQDGLGKGAWRDGVWKTVILIPRAQEQFTFERGKTIPVAFAAWDGAHHERGGEKAVSTWYFLSLEKPIGTFPYIAPVVVVIGAALIEIAGLRKLCDKRAATDQRGRKRPRGKRPPR